MNYSEYCFAWRERSRPAAHHRADFEARLLFHDSEARKYLLLSKDALTSSLWDARMGETFLRRAKRHKRQVVNLLRAGNRGERWDDDTPAFLLRREGPKP